MFFSEVIGQQTIKDQLIRSVQQGRVSHALLFLGPEGTGNLAMALALAQYLNCENRNENDSCGKCPSCNKAQKFIHPDIHFTFPIINVDKKDVCGDWMPEWREFLQTNKYGNYNDWISQLDAENKQGNITAKECADIIRKLTLKSFESPFKILIMWLPEFLEKEGNRLLKIIEEPPDNTIFILVANDQERIINTILSRLQMVKFPRLSEPDLAYGISTQLQIDPIKARKIAAQSDGDFNEARKIAAMHEDENTAVLRDWMDACLRQNIKESFKWNEQFVKLGREYQKSFFQYCLHFYRQILLTELGLKQLTSLNDTESKMAEGLGKVLGRERITAIIELLDKSIYFVERNANAKILINYISISMMKHFNRNYFSNKQPFFEKWNI